MSPFFSKKVENKKFDKYPLIIQKINDNIKTRNQYNSEVKSLFSVLMAVKNKNGLIEIFETLSHFPNLMMMLKSGEYTVDAHSLMGVFAIDISKPFELILESEPDNSFKEAISGFTLERV